VFLLYSLEINEDRYVHNWVVCHDSDPLVVT
jgi:hypothetical protein